MERGGELSLSTLEAVGVTAVSVPVLVGSFLGAALLAGRLHPELPGLPALAVTLPFLAGIPVTLVLHELVHAGAFRALGARARLRFTLHAGLPFFYVEAPGHVCSRAAMLAVGMAPLLVLDAVGLVLLPAPGIWSLGVALVACNTAGATGDAWLCLRLLGRSADTRWEVAGGRFYAWTPTRSS